MSTDSVEHRWAHQIPNGNTKKLEYGGNSNFHYSGNRLYSYSTVIAQLFHYDKGPVVFINTRSYSDTTHKHQRAARYATNHMKQFVVRGTVSSAFGLFYTGRGWSGYDSLDSAIEHNIVGIIDQLTDFLKKVSQPGAKLTRGDYNAHLALRNEINELLEYTDKSRKELLAAWINCTKYNEVWTLAFSNAENNFLHMYVNAVRKGDKFYDFEDIEAEWNRQEAITQRRRAGAQRAAETRRANDEERRRLARIEMQLVLKRSKYENVLEEFGVSTPEEVLQLWRDSKISQLPNHQTSPEDARKLFEVTRLRIVDDEVRTSRGASVPIDLDKFTIIMSCVARKSDVGALVSRIGHYSKVSYDYDLNELQVGCHRIPFEELQYIANQLNINAEQPAADLYAV